MHTFYIGYIVVRASSFNCSLFSACFNNVYPIVANAYSITQVIEFGHNRHSFCIEIVIIKRKGGPSIVKV